MHAGSQRDTAFDVVDHRLRCLLGDMDYVIEPVLGVWNIMMGKVDDVLVDMKRRQHVMHLAGAPAEFLEQAGLMPFDIFVEQVEGHFTANTLHLLKQAAK